MAQLASLDLGALERDTIVITLDGIAYQIPITWTASDHELIASANGDGLKATMLLLGKYLGEDVAEELDDVKLEQITSTLFECRKQIGAPDLGEA